MKTIMTIVGARPQFVKAAPVSRELRKRYKEVLVNTGQHYDHNMAGIFFEELHIPRPDYDLGVGSASHGKQTGDILIKIERLIEETKPSAVLVYGDTNSTLAGSLAASKLHIPLFHIEAGLRSYDKEMPEEINRILTDHVSTLLFAPTESAVRNLQAENITKGVHLVGDVMYDAVLHNYNLTEEKYKLDTFGVHQGNYYLSTIHRAGNTDDPARLQAIIHSLLALNETVLFPIHPRTEKMLRDLKLIEKDATSGNIRFIPPVSYLEMLLLERHAKAIITDSGGVQKEAYFAKVPCFTLRNETEWVETVESGWNTLVDPLTMDLNAIISAHQCGPYIDNLYGDGKASVSIVKQIYDYLG
ncbi:non-hydrolyzing UDP-N-acetylglucosamine 2-epimerase [Paenibacillus segetis]|jgi:UDP-N-acetylglucosamine 2-epimerase|uniref:UDP-N-acetyl glucosamine 2-epimerase n=1 Tax=Paenibacillus segetis TaxID=1325360 RepID=A0ABQ1YPG7_9BACL|nr:UDP-N-acetylglucosamine 2-epimerase (non-hydrolyzing) [Paenibacillus segetis]GGH32151.1 UDP-N-acetyl glucosamine 2-epimerase [Paenibacillus segetis]